MINFAGTPERSGDWTWFIALVVAKKLAVQYEEDAAVYRIYSYDNPEVLTCLIWKGTLAASVVDSGYSQAQNDADKTDFETNHKPTANAPTVPRSSDGTPVHAKQQLALGRIAFQRTDDASTLMNINALPSGTAVVVWNGTGGSDTGGDWTVTGDGSETAGSAHAGTNGWDSGPRGANDFTQFDNGSEIDVAGTYDTFSFWIQVKNFPGNGNLQVQWKNAATTTIGTTLSVENYVTNMDPNVWQKVTIPVADFNLTGDVQRLNVVYKTGNNQQHWLDDFELTAAGGTGNKTFRTQSPSGVVYHVERLVLVVSAPDTGWSSTAFANIASGLTNGVLLKYHNIGPTPQTFWTANFKDNTELFGQMEAWNTVNFDNAEQLIAFSIDPDLSSVILVDDDDVLDIIIRDDLSSLTNVRAFLHIGTEVVA
jgi:hypothetical protein